ncbi:MAG: hypothetical protein V7L05_09120 [Nostoc sp.]|uniref:hypothetical protein n=1 Tax=Nostoc sp. TaxID=1180 RepID=UPI002FF774A6
MAGVGITQPRSYPEPAPYPSLRDARGERDLATGDGNDFLDISGSSDTAYDYFEFYDSRSSGKNTLNGGAGNDTLSAIGSTGDNLFSGGDGNDSLDVSDHWRNYGRHESS